MFVINSTEEMHFSKIESKPEIIVPIRGGEYSRRVPIGKILVGREVFALIVSFFGHNRRVYGLMQTMNHNSRAYIHHERGLKIFLKSAVMTELKLAEEKGEIDALIEY